MKFDVGAQQSQIFERFYAIERSTSCKLPSGIGSESSETHHLDIGQFIRWGSTVWVLPEYI